MKAPSHLIKLRGQTALKGSFPGLLMMLACQNASSEQLQVFSLIAFLQIGAKYQNLTGGIIF